MSPNHNIALFLHSPAARYYNSSLSIWISIDPLSDKYPNLSPYTYCAGNPVRLVDPDGEAWEPIIDENNKTITISAKYYVSEKNREKLQEGLNVWNSLSGKYSYIVGSGNNKEKYTINFDLTIVTDETGNSFLPDNKVAEYTSNYFEISNELFNEQNARGETMNGYNIRVKPTAPFRTIIHEIGHTIGLGEFTGGVMESGGDSKKIYSTNIVSIMENSGFRCVGTWSGPALIKPTSATIDEKHLNWDCIGHLKKNFFKK
ncbi:MAG: hypothetical protein IJT51_08280 [Bacteroidales bacterium]|nr:hypothetical protein [Bacteroidales bacterium]